MKPLDGMNSSKTSYFSLEEYVSNIKLNDDTLYHLEDTTETLDKYMSKVSQISPDTMVSYGLSSLTDELKSVNGKSIILPTEVIQLLSADGKMDHTRLQQIRHYLYTLNTDYKNMERYRAKGEEVKLSSYNNYSEQIYWRGAESESVKKFMDDFLKVYKSHSSFIDQNPLLKSTLMSLLMFRIHPFNDGNSRTARMVQNIKLTELMNQIYGLDLKFSPLNMSKNVQLYRQAYLRKVNNIYFDLEHECNDEINDYFDFMLTRADETLFYNDNQLQLRRK